MSEQETQIYVGQFKEDDRLLEYNYLHYKIICTILNLYCLIDSTNEHWVSGRKVDDVKNLLYQYGIDKNIKDIDAKINATVLKMQLSGLITRDGDFIFIAEEGKKAYCDQRYDVTLAQLVEAKEARRLANWSRWLAIIAILISLASIIITIFK